MRRALVLALVSLTLPMAAWANGIDLFNKFGTFTSVGSFFKVVGVGQAKGTIFSGVFVGPITWTLVSQSAPTLIFQLSGALSGMLHNGHMTTGTTTQLFKTTTDQLAKGIVHITSGDTHLTAAPEPGTLAMFGLGLLGIASKAKRGFTAGLRRKV